MLYLYRSITPRGTAPARFRFVAPGVGWENSKLLLTQICFRCSLEPHALDTDPALSWAVDIDQHDGLPLPEHKAAATDGDGLAAAEQHSGQMRMRIDGLLIAPTLQHVRFIHIPSILEAPCRRHNTRTKEKSEGESCSRR